MRIFQIAFLIAAVLTPAACGKDSHKSPLPFIPGVGAVVVENTPDNFRITGGGTNVDAWREYTWVCNDDQANIRIDAGLTLGSIGLTILDGAGNLVHDNTYDAVLGGEVLAVTRPGGEPGSWQIRLDFDTATWGGSFELAADLLDEPDVVSLSGGYIVPSGSLEFAAGWGDGPVQVDLAGAPASGSMRIQIRDGSYATVYDETFYGPTGGVVLEDTLPGVAGTWWVHIDFFSTVDGGMLIVSQAP